MSSKSFVPHCLMTLATMIFVASVAAAAEPNAPGSQPQAATRTEEPGGQVDPHASQILGRACNSDDVQSCLARSVSNQDVDETEQPVEDKNSDTENQGRERVDGRPRKRKEALFNKSEPDDCDSGHC
jgi:hypothetical protein